MRALLATVLLLAAPAAAAARPLDPDRSFARDGFFRLDQPERSASVIALADGGTLHVTGHGLMRLSAGGKLRGFTGIKGGGVAHVVPGLAVGTGTVEYGKPTPLMTWPLDAQGALGAPQTIALPGGRSAEPVRAVRRRGGYAVLVWSGRRMLLVALTRQGALDTAWGDGGLRTIEGAGYDDLALAAAGNGSLVVASTAETMCERRGYTERKERVVLVARRFTPGGRLARTRRMTVGGRDQCPAADTGEALVDGRGRILVAGRFGSGATLLRLTPGLRRDRFTVRVRRNAGWWLPARLERRPGGGYALGFTSGSGSVPRGTVALISARGRLIAARRLKVTRSYPTSDLDDIVFDRRGRFVAAGSLRDTDVFIREDFGMPHLAVWRLRPR